MSDTGLQRIDGSALRFHLSGDTVQPSSLVFLLHGSGSHGGDLLPVAERLAAVLPRTLFVLPDAPQSYREVLPPDQVSATERAKPGIDWLQSRTWFSGSDSAGQDKESQRLAFLDMIRPPVRALNRLAGLLLAQRALPASTLGVYGFSQGGMMALYFAVDRTEPCASVICHSGQFFGGVEARSHPRTLLLVGEKELEPTQVMSQVYPLTVKSLRALGVPFEEQVVPGLLHGVNAQAIERIGTFLVSSLESGEGAIPGADRS